MMCQLNLLMCTSSCAWLCCSHEAGLTVQDIKMCPSQVAESSADNIGLIMFANCGSTNLLMFIVGILALESALTVIVLNSSVVVPITLMITLMEKIMAYTG